MWADAHAHLVRGPHELPARRLFRHELQLGRGRDDQFRAVQGTSRRLPNMLGTMAGNTTYYWRIDEVIGGTNFAKGDVWRFTTASDAIHGDLAWHLKFDTRNSARRPTDPGRPAVPRRPGWLAAVDETGHAGRGLFVQRRLAVRGVEALNFSGSEATIAAWVRRGGALNKPGGIVFFRNNGTGPSGLGVGTANELRYHWNGDGSTYNWNSTLTLPDAQWALVVIVVSSNRAGYNMGTIAAYRMTAEGRGFTGVGTSLRGAIGLRQKRPMAMAS